MWIFKKKKSKNEWMELECLDDLTPLVELEGKMMFCPRCQRAWSKEFLHAGVVLADAADKVFDDLMAF